MKTFMFPGQGSQAVGMGGDLFDDFKGLTNKADKILGYSIKELCHENPRKELNNTQFTQPALYVVNALSYFKEIEESGDKPDFVIGHSLGEFNALLAAECFDFEAGLKLVKKRGEFMSQVTDGGMAAILNASKQETETILEENGLVNIDLANYNTPSQIVISGLREEIVKAQSFFQEGKTLYFPLNTSGAFHSRFMQPVRVKFESYLKRFKFADLKIPVISNVSAKPYRNDEIALNMARQITSSVKWSASIEYLMALGDMTFEELGHGDVLTKLVQKIRREVSAADDSASQTKPKKPPAQAGNGTQEKPVEKTKADQQPEPEKVQLDQDESNRAEQAVTLTADEKVNAWNKNHPTGTKVKSSIMDYDDLETRTEAVVLFGHRAAVYMKGYNGYFDLDEIEPS